MHGYLFLLVDEYPPFAFFEAPEYPIQAEIPEATRLNPAAVFFRIILMVPGWIVTSVVGEGAAVVSFFVWVIMLFTGRQPEPAFGATSAVLRFETRFMAFAGMLTPTQPKALFGDAAGAGGRPADRRSPTRPLLLSSGGQDADDRDDRDRRDRGDHQQRGQLRHQHLEQRQGPAHGVAAPVVSGAGASRSQQKGGRHPAALPRTVLALRRHLTS